jgi:hypothetical protein
MKGTTKESGKQAMEELFARVHTLAEKYRAEDEKEHERLEKRAAATGAPGAEDVQRLYEEL